MKLQKLFKDKIINFQALSPGYENHASDVWLVKTEKEEVIVRASREKEDNFGPFWAACQEIFDINPIHVHALASINNVLCDISSIKIPRVLRTGYIDKEYVVVEKLEGKTLQTFINQPRELLYSLGVGLAQIHKHQFDYVGNPLGTLKTQAKHFHVYLIEKIQKIVSQYYTSNHKIMKQLLYIINQLERIPPPNKTSYVLVDMDPTQFLTDGKYVTGLVDTEAYVIAPRELDFIALEYVLDQKSAQDFIDGYKTIMPIPDLSPYRIVYRYLYRLIEIQGKEELDVWLNHPAYIH